MKRVLFHGKGWCACIMFRVSKHEKFEQEGSKIEKMISVQGTYEISMEITQQFMIRV